MCLLFIQCGCTCINIDTIDWLFNFVYRWICWLHATHDSATYKVLAATCTLQQTTPHPSKSRVNIYLSLYIYTCIYIFVYVIFSFRHFFSCRTDVLEIRKFKRKLFFVCLHVIWIKEVCCIRAGELVFVFYFI